MQSNPAYYPTAQTKKAVAIVAHGLNVRPDAMLPLVHWLNNHGCDACLIKLSGHFEGSPGIAAISLTTWQDEMIDGYEFAKQISSTNNIPLFFVGYSLGALLGQDMMLSLKSKSGIHKQVILAPAIAIRKTALLLKLVFWWKGLSIPSLTPAFVKANNRLSINAYKMMFSAASKVMQTGQHINIPTLAVIDPRDELINYKMLLKVLKDLMQGSYEVLKLQTNMQQRKGGYHHLIISEETMGAVNWKNFTDKMEQFLF